VVFLKNSVAFLENQNKLPGLEPTSKGKNAVFSEIRRFFTKLGLEKKGNPLCSTQKKDFGTMSERTSAACDPGGPSVLQRIARCLGKILLSRKEPEMIKVSIFYPHKEGGQFDMQYYLETHMPMSI
jgi:hypothetical protein